MGWKIRQASGDGGRKERSRAAWSLARQQHDVLTRQQLLGLGFTRREIERRTESGRLHRVRTGVYAVGRPSLTKYGRWMAAVLACGDGAVLSHSSAAALWRIGIERNAEVHISLPSQSHREVPDLHIHRRPSLNPARDITREYGIPCTTPVQTLIDMSLRLDRLGVERMINEADKYNLMHPPQLREALDERAGEPGVARLRHILDRRTFRLTKEELERRFLPLAREAGLPTPLLQATAAVLATRTAQSAAVEAFSRPAISTK